MRGVLRLRHDASPDEIEKRNIPRLFLRPRRMRRQAPGPPDEATSGTLRFHQHLDSLRESVSQRCAAKRRQKHSAITPSARISLLRVSWLRFARTARESDRETLKNFLRT